MKKIVNSKMIAIILVTVIIVSMFGTIFNVVFAQNDVVLDFQEGTLEDGKVIYTVDNKKVPVELVIKDNTNNEYQAVNITNIGNTPIDLDASDYYLHVDRTNNNNVQIRIGGNVYPIPGDDYLGLPSEDFQGGVQGVRIESNSQEGTGGTEGAQGSEGQQEDQPIEAMKFDFTINGESFTNVVIGDAVVVSNNFNMDTIEEFYITKIAFEGGRTYIYEAGEYSYELLDNQNRKILETHFRKISENYANIRIESHSMDILDKDIAQGKSRDDYFGFYITGINFVKSAFRGVEVSTGVMPDNYDFTFWNGADLAGTTESNPVIVTAYYGEDTISFSSVVSSGVSEISLVSDSGIPSDAVNINNETGEITVLSNYYNEIPLQIKLEDGTTGYITVNRIGIFIDGINAGSDTFYHGAAAIVSGNLDVDTDKNRIVAVFYHEDTKTYKDYDLIANITNEDGSTETVIAQGVGDIHNSTGNIIGSDYILWKGNSGGPKKISVTAVQKGALSDSNTFGGAKFGSGTGVEWEGN